MDALIQKYYPKKLPHVSSVQDVMRLRLSHLGVVHLNRRLILDVKDVTHVRTEPSGWMTLSRYLRLYATYLNVVDLADASLVHPSTLPDIRIVSVRMKSRAAETSPVYYGVAPVPRVPRDRTVFEIRSFEDDRKDVSRNLAEVIDRLWSTRDSLPCIHFRLEGNSGGSLTAAYLIVRCLAGPRRPWMVDESVIETQADGTRASRTWDPWIPEKDANQTRILKSFKFNGRADYAAAYAGPITLHVDADCASATWYFITLMVYAFSETVERGRETRLGVPVKVGRCEGGTLRIEGHSTTCSEDGNAELLPLSSLTMIVPTQVRVASSIQHRDFGRFWLPTKK